MLTLISRTDWHSSSNHDIIDENHYKCYKEFYKHIGVYCLVKLTAKE